MKFKKQLKSYSFWLGIISAILLVIKSIFKIDLDMEYANETLTAILGALVVAGIINYPTDDADGTAHSGDDAEQTTDKRLDDKIDDKDK